VGDLYRRAGALGARAVVFPELVLCAYTCGDLFYQERLLEEARRAALDLAAGLKPEDPLLVFGLPVRARGLLFNCAALAWGGRIIGLVPKTYLPNTGEFYEQRWFTSAAAVWNRPDFASIPWGQGGGDIPFGTDLLFYDRGDPAFILGVEICEDLWAPAPPSSYLALGGASVIFNLSASNELVGKAQYRKDLVLSQSARCIAAYLYVSAGAGESTTDLVYGGDALIAENGRLLAQARRFQRTPELVIADLDPAYLAHERSRSSSFSQGAGIEGPRLNLRRINFGLAAPEVSGKAVLPAKPSTEKTPGAKTTLLRPLDPRPFVPQNSEDRRRRCEEILSIQAAGLTARFKASGCSRAVLGLSGGLDSTLALLVCVRAFDGLGRSRRDIHCLTMPGFGTTGRTLANVQALSAALGVDLRQVDIKEACLKQLADLNHSADSRDAAYENVQARYRTSLLMNTANMIKGLVVGTGDLSELALGWCTYNGDHMSMYSVNAGVPKTLVKYLVAFAGDSLEEEGQAEAARVLRDIINTPISPELLPPDKAGEIAQKTESLIGPYLLHDFFLYNGIRCGFSPAKVFFLACLAFAPRKADKEAPGDAGETFAPEAILKWLKVFYTRFFSQQFKRSCLPDGPKVGTLALSPRGDWRMPSDGAPAEWLKELEAIKPPAMEPPDPPSRQN
jgi:NAD+ synthase (glutamine-hydrolysing)